MPGHALAVQVFAVAVLGAFLPSRAGLGGGAIGVGFAGGVGQPLILGQTLAQAVALLGAEFVLGNFDLGGVVDRTAPHPIAANDQVVTVVHPHFVQVIPAALF